MDNDMMNLVKAITSQFGKDVTVKAYENGKPVVDIENGGNKLNEAIKNSTKSKEGNSNYVKFPKNALKPIGIIKYDCPETADKDFVFVPKVDICGIDDSTITGQMNDDECIKESKIVDPIENLKKILTNTKNKSLEESKSSEPIVPPIKPINLNDEPEKQDSEEIIFGPGEKFTNITKDIYKDNFDETYIIRNSVNGNKVTTETVIPFDFTGEDGITTPGVTDADLLLVLLHRNRNNKEIFESLLSILQNL